jgi:hypothetical protein
MGQTTQVRAGDDIQKAIFAAQSGDELVVQAGSTFGPQQVGGSITLPAFSGSQPITLRSSAMDQLPLDGQRIDPKNAAAMPKIVTRLGAAPALMTQPGAHHWRLLGIEILPETKDAFCYDLVTLGDGSAFQASLDVVPQFLVLDRCYIHIWPDQEIKRGIALDSGDTAIINSYVSGFKVIGQDSQAICGWNGPGPFKLDNNYVEAAGENIMFGGSPTSIANLIPSDIAVTNCTVTKLMTWNKWAPQFGNKEYSCKNLLELKSAQRVKISGNRFQNNWAGSQTGGAILITPRGDQSGGPWCRVKDVEFTDNDIIGSAQGCMILGSDSYSISGNAENLLFQNNRFHDVAGNNPLWGAFTSGSPTLFLLVTGMAGGVKGLIIDHNTCVVCRVILSGNGSHSGLVLTNNMLNNGDYGIKAEVRPGRWHGHQRSGRECVVPMPLAATVVLHAYKGTDIASWRESSRFGFRSGDRGSREEVSHSTRASAFGIRSPGCRTAPPVGHSPAATRCNIA